MRCLIPALVVPVGLGALAVGLLLLSAIPDPASPVTAANAARLKAGMAMAAQPSRCSHGTMPASHSDAGKV